MENVREVVDPTNLTSGSLRNGPMWAVQAGLTCLDFSIIADALGMLDEILGTSYMPGHNFLK